jgi:hypothetical protein
MSYEAEAALAEYVDALGFLSEGFSASARQGYLAGFRAALARSWTVNDDGSVSPPGHTDETAWIIREQRPDDIARPWFWFLAPPTGAHYPGESDNEETFAAAKAALLKALEEREWG